MPIPAPLQTGNRAQVRHSSGAMAVIMGASKNRSAGQSRVPPGPSASSSASRATATRGDFGGRIAVNQAAADGAPVAGLQMAHETERLGEQGNAAPDRFGAFRRALTGHRADRHRAVAGLDPVEPGDPVDVDQQVGARETHRHQRHQSLAAGDDLVRPAGPRGGQGRAGRRHAVGPEIVEFGRFHFRPCIARRNFAAGAWRVKAAPCRAPGEAPILRSWALQEGGAHGRAASSIFRFRSNRASDPTRRGFEPEIVYQTHTETAGDLCAFFPGLEPDQLPDREGWAIEWIRLSTHNGTHVDAPWHYHSTMDGGESAPSRSTRCPSNGASSRA